MSRNRPITDKTIRRAPDVRGQIQAAAKARREQMGEEVKFLQEQLNQGDERIEELKGQIVTTKRTNNTMRVGALAAVAAGTLATNLTILQGSDTTTDSALKYAIVIGACFAGFLMNRHFNDTDITMSEMLKRANNWSRQEFTPEEIQTFKELYDEVKCEFEANSRLKKDVKSNFIYQSSQGVILALAIASLTSGADKLGYSLADYIMNSFDNNDKTLKIDPNDPALNSGVQLHFPDFE